MLIHPDSWFGPTGQLPAWMKKYTHTMTHTHTHSKTHALKLQTIPGITVDGNHVTSCPSYESVMGGSIKGPTDFVASTRPEANRLCWSLTWSSVGTTSKPS